MAAEGRPDDADWLDALAGRQPDPDAQALRDALLPLPPVDRPPWERIEARARAEPAAQVRIDATSTRSANDERAWSRLAWAAVLVLAVGLGAWLLQPAAPDGLRGQDAPGGAAWLVADPAAATDRLVADLQQAGARVERIDQPGKGLITLRIEAPRAAVGAVNARLAALETGLDAQGRLELTVRPAP